MGWKRVVGGLVAVGAVGVLGLGALVAWTFSGMGAIVDGEAVHGAIVVQDGYVSAGIVPLPDGTVALVDAGNDADADAIVAALGRLGKGPHDVSAIFLTHGHPDHTAGCAKFPFAATYALAAELPLLRGEATPKGPLPRLFPAHAAACPRLTGVTDAEVVSVGGATFTALAIPGHTAGSAAWRIGPVLFVGDSADAAADGTLLGAKWVFSDDVTENHDALVALAGRVDGVETLVCAHSGTVPVGALRAFR